MKCDRIQEDIKAYIDGELGWFARRRVARHLAHCAACKTEFEEITKLSLELRELPDAPVPDRLRSRVLSQIELKPAERHSPIRRLASLPAVGVLAAALIIFAVAVTHEPLSQEQKKQTFGTSAAKQKPANPSPRFGEPSYYRPPLATSAPEPSSGPATTAPSAESKLQKSVVAEQPASRRAPLNIAFMDGRTRSKHAASMTAKPPTPLRKTVRLSLAVDDPDRVCNQLAEMYKPSSGQVKSLDSWHTSDSVVMTMNLPEKDLDNTIRRIKQLGTAEKTNADNIEITLPTSGKAAVKRPSTLKESKHAMKRQTWNSGSYDRNTPARKAPRMARIELTLTKSHP
jgi:hypothetical protein